MKTSLVLTLTLFITIMAEAQIRNVTERNGVAYIEQEDGYRKGSTPSISLTDSILAGWNSQIVVVIHNVSSNSSRARIYDYNGNVKKDSDLGMVSATTAKITVTANGILANINGTTYQYDLNGKRK